MKHLSAIIIGFSFLQSLTAAAQSDYVITKKGDTLRGRLEYTYKAPPRLVTKDTSIWCHPSLTRGYYESQGNKLFRSAIIPEVTEPVFLQVLESGKINLYEWEYVYENTGTPTTTITWYGEKSGLPLKELKRTGLGGNANHRKEAVEVLISDNGPLANEFMNKELFSFKYLRELIRKYNDEARKRVSN